MFDNWRMCNFLVLLALLALVAGCSPDDDDDWVYLTPDQHRSWESAELLTEVTGPDYSVGDPVAAMSGPVTIAVWYKTDNDGHSIMAETFDGAPAKKIDDDDGLFVKDPQIAMTDEGKAIVVWLKRKKGDIYSIMANTFDGTNWGGPQEISKGTTDASTPQVAVSADGTAVAVWQQIVNAAYDDKNIWANTFNGTKWGEAKPIHPDADDNNTAHVAMTSDGKAVAVWNRETGSSTVSHQIWTNTFDGEDWAMPEQISNADDSSVGGSHVAMTADGKAIAVWQQYDGTRYCIWGNTFDGTDWDSRAWETPEQIATDTAGHCLSAQVAMSSDGSAVAVWQLNKPGGNGQHVRAKFFNGETWDEETTELDDSSGNACFSEVAMSSGGSAVAVWYQREGEDSSIWASSFDCARWSTAEELDTGTGDTGFPRVAISADGSAVSVWHEFDKGDYSIWASFSH